MKKIILLILFPLTLFSCSEKRNTVVEGNMNNAERSKLYIDYLNINKPLPLDSLKVKKDGDFKFRLAVDHPGLYMLRNEKGEIINLILEPGQQLQIEADYNTMDANYSVSGSKESEYIRRLVEKIQDTRERLTNLDETYGSLPSTSEDQATDYINQRKSIIRDQRDFSIQFIIEHLNSLASIYALYQTITPGQYVLGENRDIQYMKIVADSVSVKYPDSPFVTSFVKDARSTENKYHNLKNLQQNVSFEETGSMNLELPNPQGDSISLHSLRGKPVLIYFWSSFSKASRELNPALLDVYHDYRDRGFEIYAVSLDTQRAPWLGAIRYDELDWINVSELEPSGSTAAAIYNVNTLPTSYLLNKQGDIVARDIYGRELRKWLDNLTK